MTAGTRYDDPTTFDVRATPCPTGWAVTVCGDVDATTAPRLADLLLDVLTRPGATVVDLDLRRVTFLDSAGLTALVAGHQEAQRGGRVLRVLPGTRRAVLRPLDITGLATVLHIVDAGEAVDVPVRPG